MTIVATVPFTLNSGTRTFGPFTIPDAIKSVRGSVAPWTGQGKLSLSIEMSLDGGATWRPVCSISEAGPATFKANDGLWLRFDGLWRLCQCGEVYIPGHPANAAGLLVHSSHAFQDIRGLPQSAITFHNPDLTPATGQPLRQVRLTAVATGNINSTFTAEVT
jgi:hypothetical protein